MIKIIDTYNQIGDLFIGGNFDFEKWKKYINSMYPDCDKMFTDDVKEYIATGKYTFEQDFLPIINNVFNNPKLDAIHRSFLMVIDGLNKKIERKFGREVDAEIVLYLGLCNGAGWVTDINGKTVILLGVEKIIELDWCSIDDMRGLIYHELGHVYQAQYGVLERESAEDAKNFIWQLFVEGVAMYFEQLLVGDIKYYHQDKNGWKAWCDEHFVRILQDFKNDIATMTEKDQRYFGDWADYHGKGDVGYYLGARFVHFMLQKYKFDEIIDFDIDAVCTALEEFN